MENKIIAIIGTIIVIGLLFALGVFMFDGLKTTQTVDSTSYNVSDKILDATTEYSDIYPAIVWLGIFLIVVFLLFTLYAVVAKNNSF